MKRRGFLARLLGILAIPSILPKLEDVKAESIPDNTNHSIGNDNFTMEMWTSSCGEWQHITHVYEGNKVHIYADGFYVKTIDSYINAHGTIDKVLYNG